MSAFAREMRSFRRFPVSGSREQIKGQRGRSVCRNKNMDALRGITLAAVRAVKRKCGHVGFTSPHFQLLQTPHTDLRHTLHMTAERCSCTSTPTALLQSTTYSPSCVRGCGRGYSSVCVRGCRCSCGAFYGWGFVGGGCGCYSHSIPTALRPAVHTP